jgi:rhodanese-related sulfurtransferase
MSIKILFSPVDGKLLGAQVVGAEGADKRIDILATAIRAGMTVYDLEEIEHAYAPPFSSAKDPVNIAGFVAANILRGDVEAVSWSETAILSAEPGYVFLDLRNNSELDNVGLINGAVNIPVNSLRSRLNELDKSKTYLVFCAVGLRAYIGCRILTQNGFKAKNISGGFTSYMYIKDTINITTN